MKTQRLLNPNERKNTYAKILLITVVVSKIISLVSDEVLQKRTKRRNLLDPLLTTLRDKRISLAILFSKNTCVDHFK